MTKKFCTFAAAVFALLALIAPAHAAVIQWDLSGVTAEILSVSVPTVTGFFDYNAAPCCSAANFPNYSLTLSGDDIETFTFTPLNSHFESTGNASLSLINNGATIANIEDLGLGVGIGFFDGTTGSVLTLSPFTSGFVANNIKIGGLVELPLQGELIEASVSAVPLPAALPLFGSAVLVLASFAASRSRRAGRE